MLSNELGVFFVNSIDGVEVYLPLTPCFSHPFKGFQYAINHCLNPKLGVLSDRGLGYTK